MARVEQTDLMGEIAQVAQWHDTAGQARQIGVRRAAIGSDKRDQRA